MLVFLGLVSTSALSFGDPSLTERRDKALKEVEACLRRNEISSRECRNINAAVDTLVDVYNQGDKSVLPTLLKFTYLTRFYGDALLGDREGFLKAVSELPEPNQRHVALGLAGQLGGLPKERFEVIRRSLTGVPPSAPVYDVARRMLATLEMKNAALLVDYFPPDTFPGSAGDSQVRWYSSDLYALGEKPLRPESPNGGSKYRMTVIPAFSGPRTAVLTILPDGTGQITVKVLGRDGQLEVNKTETVSLGRVAEMTKQLHGIKFWELPTEVRRWGNDGAEYILEGAQGGRYHVVVRWCPGVTHQSQFGWTAKSLFELAGYTLNGC